MKLIAVILIFVVGFLAYRFFQLRPRLVATSNLEGKIVPWDDIDPEKTMQIEEAFRLTKELIPQTLVFRIKAREGKFADAIPTTVYFVEEKDWFYIFADNYPYKAPGIELSRGRSLEKSIRYHKLTKKFELTAENPD